MRISTGIELKPNNVIVIHLKTDSVNTEKLIYIKYIFTRNSNWIPTVN